MCERILIDNRPVGFGAPAQYGEHHFRVEIPSAKQVPVYIAEDFGYRGPVGGFPGQINRVALSLAVWGALAPSVCSEFNGRLKKAKTPTGRWHTGTNFVDRLLGKELCVLAWAAETANEDQLPVIASKWTALRPEERWWLFAMTVAEAGLPEDTQRGWRRALFFCSFRWWLSPRFDWGQKINGCEERNGERMTVYRAEDHEWQLGPGGVHVWVVASERYAVSG